MSALVRVRSANGKFIQARALLDTCATANFVTENLAKQLKLPMNICSIPIGAVNELQTCSKRIVKIFCTSLNNQFQRSLSFLTVSQIADFVPSETFPRDSISIPTNIKLADPQFHLPRAVDLLIGSGTTLSLLSIGQIDLSCGNCDLILQKTQLGWVIVGGIDSENKGQGASCHLTDLSSQLSRFWVIEDASSNSSRSFEESLCETHYQTHTTRDPSGRYIVRLPFRTENVDFGDSKSRALKRFLSLQRRLNTDSHLKSEYFKVMQEYIDLGHTNFLPDDTGPGYYMPHHPVVKASSNTTKIRVVFDASAKTDKGISLNNTLLVGPTIQDKLFTHLLRFRSHSYVLTADIAQMYRQVFIHPDDRRFQRILWYHNGQIGTFELNRVTFGVSSAPYSATRSIVQLADDESDRFPIASQILKRDLYVDDLLTGANSLTEVLLMRDEIVALLRRGGFDIRQWASNHHHALDNFDERTLDLDCAIDEASVSKTLGIVWNSQVDSFIYTVNPIDSSLKVTKRNLLSNIAKIFDPLGLLGPVVLAAKIIIQECWKAKVHWDESVPQALNLQWIKFAEQLELIRDFSFNRHLIISNATSIEIHGFCDASKVGYGACLYLRSSDSNHHVTDLIIREIHQKTHHAGIQGTLCTIRHRLWLLDGKSQVRRVVRRCVDCIRHRPKVVQGKMADLPSARVEESAAFSHVGVDYFGPLYIKERKFRNRIKVKVYGCVFICMATKAVHIEISSDLTTDGFLGPFSRFISRRGIPSTGIPDGTPETAEVAIKSWRIDTQFRCPYHRQKPAVYAMATGSGRRGSSGKRRSHANCNSSHHSRTV